MLEYTIEHNGVVYAQMTAAAIIEAGVPEAVVTAHVQQVSARAATRGQINLNVGDVQTLLGTTADTAALSVLVSAALIGAVSASSDYASFKTAFLASISTLSGSADAVALSNALIQNVGNETVSMPLIDKGLDTVFADIEARNTAVSAAMTGAQA